MDWMKLKSGSDVRGVAVGENRTLTPHVAACLGMAFARFVAEKKHKSVTQVTIARDATAAFPARSCCAPRRRAYRRPGQP